MWHALRGEPDFETADPPTRQSRYNNYLREGRHQKPITRDGDIACCQCTGNSCSFRDPVNILASFLCHHGIQEIESWANTAQPMAATKTYAPRSRCLARSSILNRRLRRPRRLRRRPMNPDLRLNPRGLRNLRFNLIANRTPQGLPRGAQEKSGLPAIVWVIRSVSGTSTASRCRTHMRSAQGCRCIVWNRK